MTDEIIAVATAKYSQGSSPATAPTKLEADVAAHLVLSSYYKSLYFTNKASEDVLGAAMQFLEGGGGCDDNNHCKGNEVFVNASTNNSNIFVIHGEKGMGKSITTSELISRAQDHFDQARVVSRFIGTGNGSNSGFAIVKSIVEQIVAIFSDGDEDDSNCSPRSSFGKKKADDADDDFEIFHNCDEEEKATLLTVNEDSTLPELCEIFSKTLYNAASAYSSRSSSIAPLFIFLDGVNELVNEIGTDDDGRNRAADDDKDVELDGGFGLNNSFFQPLLLLLSSDDEKQLPSFVKIVMTTETASLNHLSPLFFSFTAAAAASKIAALASNINVAALAPWGASDVEAYVTAVLLKEKGAQSLQSSRVTYLRSKLKDCCFHGQDDSGADSLEYKYNNGNGISPLSAQFVTYELLAWFDEFGSSSIDTRPRGRRRISNDGTNNKEREQSARMMTNLLTILLSLDDSTKAITLFIERLEVAHGYLFVKSCFTYIAACIESGAEGLTTNEVLDLLSLDADLLDSLEEDEMLSEAVHVDMEDSSNNVSNISNGNSNADYSRRNYERRRVPPILWKFLSQDCEGVVLVKRSSSISVGNGLQIWSWAHKEVAKVIMDRYYDGKDKESDVINSSSGRGSNYEPTAAAASSSTIHIVNKYFSRASDIHELNERKKKVHALLVHSNEKKKQVVMRKSRQSKLQRREAADNFCTSPFLDEYGENSDYYASPKQLAASIASDSNLTPLLRNKYEKNDYSYSPRVIQITPLSL
jgi:hypothetical protein